MTGERAGELELPRSFLIKWRVSQQVPLLLSLRTLRGTGTRPISNQEWDGEKHTFLANISNAAGAPWGLDSPHYPSEHSEVGEG